MEEGVDVLVVGLGPVGAALTALLGQAGVRALGVDRSGAVYPLPRAVGFDHEIMRIFQRIGIADAVLAHTRETDFYDFLDAEQNLLLRFDRSAAQPRPYGWAPNLTFYQPAVEALLRERIAASATATYRTGTGLEAFDEDAEGITATLAGPAGEARVRCRYLVGCDGGASLVRQTCGIGLDDLGFDEPWLVVDFLGDDAGLPQSNFQLCDPARPATFLRMGPGRYRWEFMVLPGDDPAALASEAGVRALLRDRGMRADDPIERSALYRFHGLVARQWRRGRVLLAGDAAHQMPPFAGQGMCAGLRDAFGLAWKLAAVLRGEAGEALLDSYQQERAPHVRAIVESAIALGRVVCTTDPEVAEARNVRMRADRDARRPPMATSFPALSGAMFLGGCPAAGRPIPQPWATVDGRTLRLDDALGAGAVLIARRGPVRVAASDAAGPGLRRLTLDGPELAPFAEAIGAWLDDADAEAVLVRPDLQVFGTGAPDTLAAAWCDAFARAPACA